MRNAYIEYLSQLSPLVTVRMLGAQRASVVAASAHFPCKFPQTSEKLMATIDDVSGQQWTHTYDAKLRQPFYRQQVRMVAWAPTNEAAQALDAKFETTSH